MKRTVIVSAARTPIGSFLGGLSSLSAPKLGSIATKSALARSRLSSVDIDEVIMGHVLQGGTGQAPARQASLGAGLSSNIPCTTVNKVCGSGLKAVMMGVDSIALGHAKAVIAGGMESMSNAPYILSRARQGFRLGNQEAIDLMIQDGLQDPYGGSHMGTFGDLCAEEHGFSRQDQDEYAHQSFRRAIEAQKNNAFDQEIQPVVVENKGASTTIGSDEEPRRYRPEKFGKLNPAFTKNGSVTPANASKINDGAAALVLMEEERASEKKIKPLARILAYHTHAEAPQWFTTAPIGAIRGALKKASCDIQDVDYFEINEAFSVVPLVAMKELALPRDVVNIFGGAVSLGHPIGCSGARILVTLQNVLHRKDKRLGVAAICLGGGEAIAVVVERI